MAKMTKEEMLEIVEKSINKLKNKENSVYFFVQDTKGNPSSAAEYIYRTARTLQKMGYQVAMLHNEENFVGVGDWMGEEYASLPHYNIEKDNIAIDPSAFLFIPEIFANVMEKVATLPIKRVAIVQNADYITEFMPISGTFEKFGVIDAVAISKAQAEKTNKFFPLVRTHIVPPAIGKMFRKNTLPQKPIINIISKDQSKIRMITKSFYWRNPIYNWLTFRDLRGVSMEAYCEGLQEAAATIWVDDTTTFGYSLLEAVRCGSIVLAKVPEHPADWMVDENGNLIDSIIWFNELTDLITIIPDLIRTWTYDKIPAEVYEEMASLDNLYTEEEMVKNIEEVYVKGFFGKRLAEFEEAKIDILNGTIKSKEE